MLRDAVTVAVYWQRAIALMNNDDMPLSVYGLRPGCYVTLKVIKHKKSASREVCDMIKNLSSPSLPRVYDWHIIKKTRKIPIIITAIITTKRRSATNKLNVALLLLFLIDQHPHRLLQQNHRHHQHQAHRLKNCKARQYYWNNCKRFKTK